MPTEPVCLNRGFQNNNSIDDLQNIDVFPTANRL